jgi:hypothetical protein
MRINYQIANLVCPGSNGSLLADHCSGAFLKQFTRAALLTVVLGVAVVLATGCALNGNGLSAKLIGPMPTSQQASQFEEENSYRPAGSSAFSDFFGS